MRKELRDLVATVSVGGFSLFVWFFYMNFYYRVPIWVEGTTKGYFTFPNKGFFILYAPLIVFLLIITVTGLASALIYLHGRKKYPQVWR